MSHSKEQELIADWRSGREQLVIDYKRKCQDVSSRVPLCLFCHPDSHLSSSVLSILAPSLVFLHSFLVFLASLCVLLCDVLPVSVDQYHLNVWLAIKYTTRSVRLLSTLHCTLRPCTHSDNCSLFSLKDILWWKCWCSSSIISSTLLYSTLLYSALLCSSTLPLCLF